MKMLPSPTRHGEMRATTRSPASAGEAADEHGADRLPSTSSRRRPLPSRLKRSPPTSRWRRCSGAVEERRLRRARHGRWSSSSSICCGRGGPAAAYNGVQKRRREADPAAAAERGRPLALRREA